MPATNNILGCMNESFLIKSKLIESRILGCVCMRLDLIWCPVYYQCSQLFGIAFTLRSCPSVCLLQPQTHCVFGLNGGQKGKSQDLISWCMPHQSPPLPALWGNLSAPGVSSTRSLEFWHLPSYLYVMSSYAICETTTLEFDSVRSGAPCFSLWNKW